MVNILSNFTSKVYPDKYFVIGRKGSSGKKKCDRDDATVLENQLSAKTECNLDYNEREGSTQDSTPAINLVEPKFINRAKSSQKSQRYGLKGITADGRRRVRGAATLLEEKFGRKRLGFLTLTLPNLENGQIKFLAANWNNLARIFFQRLKREFDKLKLPFYYVAVTEIQEKRYRATKDVALHLHVTYVARNLTWGKDWYLSASKFRRMWRGAIWNQLKKCPIPVSVRTVWKAAVNCKVVRKSATRYLSKYMSKGGRVVKDIRETQPECLPRQWWTMNASMRRWLDGCIHPMNADIAEFIWEHPAEAVEAGIIGWYKEIKIELEGGLYQVAVIGWFADKEQKKRAVELDST